MNIIDVARCSREGRSSCENVFVAVSATILSLESNLDQIPFSHYDICLLVQLTLILLALYFNEYAFATRDI